MPGSLASQQFSFLGNEFGRLVHDTVRVPAANRTTLLAGATTATAIVGGLICSSSSSSSTPLVVILQATLAKVMAAGGNNRILKGLAAQETGKGEAVVRGHSGRGGVFGVVVVAIVVVVTVTILVATHAIDLVHESLHLFLLFHFLGALLFFPNLLQLPPAHGVPPIVQVDAGVPKAAKARVLVVLADVRLVIEPAGGSNVGGCADRARQELVALGVFLGRRLGNRLHCFWMVLGGGSGQISILFVVVVVVVAAGFEVVHHGLVGIVLIDIVVVIVVAVAIVLSGIGCASTRPSLPSTGRTRTAVFVLGAFESLLHFLRRFPVLLVFVRRGLFANSKARLFRGTFGFSKHGDALCCVALCCVVLCCVVLCYAMLSTVVMVLLQ